MRISIVVPTRNHSLDLEKCFASMQNQSKKPFEKIVVAYSNGGVEKPAKKYGFSIIYDKKETIGNAYYAGAKSAKGDIVLFVDDDSIAPTNLLKKIDDAFKKNPDIDIIGGDDRLPAGSSSFQQAAYQTDLAIRPNNRIVGNNAWRWLRAACIGYRKSALKKYNFNKNLTGLQEPELHERMRKEGMRALFEPSIFVYHKRRNSLKGIWNQIYRNGKAKVDLVKLGHYKMLSLEDFIPFAWIIFGIGSLIKWNNYIFPGFLTYSQLFILSIIIVIFGNPAYILSKTGNLKYYIKLTQIILVKELAYTFGIIAGILNFWRRLE